MTDQKYSSYKPSALRAQGTSLFYILFTSTETGHFFQHCLPNTCRSFPRLRQLGSSFKFGLYRRSQMAYRGQQRSVHSFLFFSSQVVQSREFLSRLFKSIPQRRVRLAYGLLRRVWPMDSHRSVSFLLLCLLFVYLFVLFCLFVCLFVCFVFVFFLFVSVFVCFAFFVFVFVLFFFLFFFWGGGWWRVLMYTLLLNNRIPLCCLLPRCQEIQ